MFDTPPFQNHCFWLPMEALMDPQRHLETIFTAIENDDRIAILLRELLDTFLHLKATPGERWA